MCLGYRRRLEKERPYVVMGLNGALFGDFSKAGVRLCFTD